LRSLGNVDESLRDSLLNDFNSADISDFDKLMLGYAEKLTCEPASINRAYVEHLKSNGFDNQTLHDIVQVTAYFNYVNRLADGLGVELEGE
jgi:uncharacterized peroxidase-related enzyme